MTSNVTKMKAATPPPAAPVDPLAKLREPFPARHISKLPKPTKAQTDAVKADFKKGIRCQLCGSWHHPDVVHLDYVGHAALTDRLLDTDPHWSWEPASFREGLPAFDPSGGLWIKLTVCGVTRLGYGHAAAKPGADPGSREKEVIGDALRNAAMRFGAALDLWHKGDLHGPAEQVEAEADEQVADTIPARSPAIVAAESSLLMCASSEDVDTWEANNKAVLETMTREQRKIVLALHKVVREKHPAKTKAPTVVETRDPRHDAEVHDFRAEELEGAFND